MGGDAHARKPAMRIFRWSRIAAAVAVLGVLSFVGCSKSAPDGSQRAGDLAVDTTFQKKLQEQLLDAHPVAVIEIPAGSDHLDRGLSLRANGVTLKGGGTEKTILSFSDQVSGPEGLVVQANDFTIEALTIEDSKGDGLKINSGDNITIRAVRVRWTDGPKTSNGAYGIYTVKTKNVLIDDSSSY